MTRRGQDEPVYRITGARRSHTEDINRRINRYLVSMAIRTVCVVLIFVLEGPLRWVAAAGAIFLPWVAVMLANASDRRSSGELSTVVDHKAISSGPTAEAGASTSSTAVLEGEIVPGPAHDRAHQPPAEPAAGPSTSSGTSSGTSSDTSAGTSSGTSAGTKAADSAR